MISLIVNSNDDVRWSRFMDWLGAVERPADLEVVRVHDAKSMCDGYRRGMDRANGDVLVFVHDDVEFLSQDFLERVADHLNGDAASFDVAGLAGTSLLHDSCCWTKSGRNRLLGQSGTPPVGGNPSYLVNSYGVLYSPARAQALDGVFIAATRKAALQLGWDAETFDGWHFYDVDFSWRAHVAGLRVAVLPDLAYVHHSIQAFVSKEWETYRTRFVEKHAATIPTGTAEGAGFYHAEAADAEAVLEAMEGRGDLARRIRGRKLDIGCGTKPAAGHEGTDISPLLGVDHAFNLLAFPWPFDDASFEAVRSSHYVEHIPELFWTQAANETFGWQAALTPYQADATSVDLLMKFFDEVHRVLAPGGVATIQVPHGRSSRAFWDPTHRRFLQEQTFHYLSKDWRKANGLEHGAYGVSCDFEVRVEHLLREDVNYLRSLCPEDVSFDQWIMARLDSWWNVADDMVVTLTKKIPAKVETTAVATATVGAGAGAL